MDSFNIRQVTLADDLEPYQALINRLGDDFRSVPGITALKDALTSGKSHIYGATQNDVPVGLIACHFRDDVFDGVGSYFEGVVDQEDDNEMNLSVRLLRHAARLFWQNDVKWVQFDRSLERRELDAFARKYEFSLYCHQYSLDHKDWGRLDGLQNPSKIKVLNSQQASLSAEDIEAGLSLLRPLSLDEKGSGPLAPRWPNSHKSGFELSVAKIDNQIKGASLTYRRHDPFWGRGLLVRSMDVIEDLAEPEHKFVFHSLIEDAIAQAQKHEATWMGIDVFPSQLALIEFMVTHDIKPVGLKYISKALGRQTSSV